MAGVEIRAPRPLGQSVYTGVETFDRKLTNVATVSSPNQTMRLIYFIAPKTYSFSNIEMASGSTAAGATPTLCRMGVYIIDAAGAGSLVAACASDTALWAGQNTAYSRALSTGGSLPSSYTLVQGQLYAAAHLCVTGAAAPTMTGSISQVAGNALFAATRGRQAGILASQSDLPTSFADASLGSATSNCSWMGLY